MVGVEKNARGVPYSEVPEKPQRRRFSAEYKLKILREADACSNEPGAIGALLRREGLYSSLLTVWRKQRNAGTNAGLEPKKRGRKPNGRRDAVALECERLRKENLRLERRLKQAELIIEAQKKVSEILGIDLPKKDEDDASNS